MLGNMAPSGDGERTGRRVLVTGGAGFIGANLATGLAARHPDWELIAFDNLRRRGSELNLPRLAQAGVRFEQGDVRVPADLTALGDVDALVECSAEPSVLAGFGGSPDYVIQTNLVGAYNCLELARRCDAQYVFLSTSRVYPVAALQSLAYREQETRLALAGEQALPGASAEGIAETFPLEGARTLYGSSKLSAELLIAEYADAYGLSAVVNRCGVIAGPWQMGKVDQGVFTYWMLAHHFGRPLEYIGFGGTGKQVRDLLHVEDLLELVEEQLSAPARWAGTTVNVGGGAACSLSLHETTELCREIAGRSTEVRASASERPGDVPIYISDCARLHGMTSWRPRRAPAEILGDIHAWIAENEAAIARTL
jgi:CDP-paratose 2-epimerase